MFVRTYWFSSLLFLSTMIALVSAGSTTHHTSTSTIKSTSTIRKSTTATSSAHHTTSSSTKSSSKSSSKSSTKSSTATPTSTPSTFYIFAEDTGSTTLDGSYFKCIPDPQPLLIGSDDYVIRLGKKTTNGASNFTLNANGTFQCNGKSGPLYASTSGGHPETQPLAFVASDKIHEFGYVTVTCAITGQVLSCQEYNLVNFLYEPSDIVNGTQLGEYVDLADPSDGAGFTIKVVPT